MNNNEIWSYRQCLDGVVERTVKIKAKRSGKPLRIAHLTDLHFNYCNQADIEENDPVLMSTYEHREWLKNGSSLENAKRTLEHAKGADAIVITGDILDYLSHGCEELTVEHIFKPYPNVIASLGNHETARKVQGLYPDKMSPAKKEEWLKSFWPNDLNYSSIVLDDRVMLIQLNNCAFNFYFNESQIEPFKRDLKIARENDYVVLMFFHVNLATENPSYKQSHSTRVGDANSKIFDLCSYGMSEQSGGGSKEICTLIKNNADIISACFCGHLHADHYSEIKAHTHDGRDALIPQYILTGTPYGKGNLLNIEIL